ncbi:hypothetical protein [Rhizobium alvei]|uniref:Transposase n=1 Tax=Rhizobium alvei TaxID=1132659 RepID=A0ABT8YHV3_9HYPH|nr:hypothetical protein [Rhizobium alvei]MDO6963007.1 hypothetical protein [Rhizobium alvei]
MAEVIRLEERLAKQPQRRSEPCEAKILLFTGVRYERWQEPKAGTVKRRGNSKPKSH